MEGHDGDALETPRAGCKRLQSNVSEKNYSLPHSASQSESSAVSYTSDSVTGEKRPRSGRASPTKNLASLQRTHILDEQSLTGGKPKPRDLEALAKLIKRDAMGRGILTPSDKTAVELVSKQCPDEPALFQDLLDDELFIDSSGGRQKLGSLPRISELVEIYKEAQECERLGQSEAAWNCGVHYPLLKAALRCARINNSNNTNDDNGGNGDNDNNINPISNRKAKHDVGVGLKNVTTARVAKEYSPLTWSTHHQKRVDFCLHIEPRDEATRDNLTTIAQQARHQGINHIDYIALLDSPISLSIETKTTGESWQEAKHQMGTWLAAHWKRLDSLINKAHDNGGTTFLPAIIVQGHDWMFLAATQGKALAEAGRETVIWSKIQFGSTYGMQGICQIIMVLQRLITWSAETYWPWFEAAVLGQRLDAT